MPDLRKSLVRVTALEELADRTSVIHRLQPSVKVFTTILYLFTVISFGPGQVSGLLPYFFYPVILMILADIPFLPLLERLLIALPFTLFAGISNLAFDREAAYTFGRIVITEGMVSFTSLILKTLLTVMAVLLLISTTTMNDLIYVLIRFRLPSIIVIQLIMTYRYIHVLMTEASTMYHSYILRTPRNKTIKLKDMGPLLGQLILKSFNRADRIYKAMKCRGFEGRVAFSGAEKITTGSLLYFLLFSTLFLILRFINLSSLIGNIIIQ